MGVLAVLSGIVAILAGLYLVFLQAAGPNSLIQAMANAIGWFCIAAGVGIIAMSLQLSSITNHIKRSPGGTETPEESIEAAKKRDAARRQRASNG